MVRGVETAEEFVVLELTVGRGGEELRERGLVLELQGDGVPVGETMALDGAC